MRVIALILFIISSPIMLAIAALIVLIDRTKILFIQKRVGLHQNEFEIYKFRTMDKERVNKFGNLLRISGLDELPQLINIIKGDMQFIGPRPLTKSDILRLGWISPLHNKRWSLKPGITGLAQLNENCNADESIKLDLYYIDHRSLKLNISILIKTFKVLIAKSRS